MALSKIGLVDVVAITGETALAATPASTDELLINDGGTIKRIDYTHIQSNLVKINRFTASNASSIDCTSVFSSTYEHYKATMRLTPANDNLHLRLRFFDSGGTVIDQDEYDWMGHVNTSPGSGTEGASASVSFVDLRLGAGSLAFSNVTAEHASFDMWFDSPNLSSAYTHMGWQMVGTAADSDGMSCTGGAVHFSAEAVSGFKIEAESGNLDGEVAVFGYKI